MIRVRVKFTRGEEIKFISHLDIVRLWERAIRRASVPLAYSQGFSPHPQISLALPLNVGMASSAELMDIYTTRAVSPQWLLNALRQQLPTGINILEVYQVNLNLPSLQSLVRFADYRITVETKRSLTELKTNVADFLALEHLPWQHQRDTGVKSYDLRILVDSISVTSLQNEECTLEMRLRADSRGAGRPEQVTAALGFSQRPLSILRTNLIFEPLPAATR